MKVTELALPREQIPHISLSRPATEIWEALRQSSLGILLVSPGDDLDAVTGFLSQDDLPPDLGAYRSPVPDPSAAVRALVILPECHSAAVALAQLERADALAAVLVDEYGCTSGLVTRSALESACRGE